MTANASTQASHAWNYIAFTCVVVSLFAFVAMTLPDQQNSTLETFEAGMSNGTIRPISTELAAIQLDNKYAFNRNVRAWQRSDPAKLLVQTAIKHDCPMLRGEIVYSRRAEGRFAVEQPHIAVMAATTPEMRQ